MMEYFGIADAHGLESFLPISEWEEQAGVLTFRTEANRHRHAVFYKAHVEPKVAEEILKCINDNEHHQALLVLKEKAEQIQVPPTQKKSFQMIPNPDLDPWS